MINEAGGSYHFRNCISGEPGADAGNVFKRLADSRGNRMRKAMLRRGVITINGGPYFSETCRLPLHPLVNVPALKARQSIITTPGTGTLLTSHRNQAIPRLLGKFLSTVCRSTGNDVQNFRRVSLRDSSILGLPVPVSSALVRNYARSR